MSSVTVITKTTTSNFLLINFSTPNNSTVYLTQLNCANVQVTLLWEQHCQNKRNQDVPHQRALAPNMAVKCTSEIKDVYDLTRMMGNAINKSTVAINV